MVWSLNIVVTCGFYLISLVYHPSQLHLIYSLTYLFIYLFNFCPCTFHFATHFCPSIMFMHQELASAIDGDPDLQEEAGIMHHVLTQLLRYQVSGTTQLFQTISHNLLVNQPKINFLIKSNLPCHCHYHCDNELTNRTCWTCFPAFKFRCFSSRDIH